MVAAQIIFLFVGRDYRVFGCPAFLGVRCRNFVLYPFFLIIVFIIVRTIVWGDPVAGWPSLVCIIFMVSGVQLLCTGIVGQYLSKTYLETKHRPIYILKDSSEENQYEQAEV